jgi:hypothetical protein
MCNVDEGAKWRILSVEEHLMSKLSWQWFRICVSNIDLIDCGAAMLLQLTLPEKNLKQATRALLNFDQAQIGPSISRLFQRDPCNSRLLGRATLETPNGMARGQKMHKALRKRDTNQAAPTKLENMEPLSGFALMGVATVLSYRQTDLASVDYQCDLVTLSTSRSTSTTSSYSQTVANKVASLATGGDGLVLPVVMGGGGNTTPAAPRLSLA